MQNSHALPQSHCRMTVGRDAETLGRDYRYWMGILMRLVSKKLARTLSWLTVVSKTENKHRWLTH